MIDRSSRSAERSIAEHGPLIADDRQAWFERVISRLESGRLPWWLLVALVYLVVATVLTVVFWVDGSTPVGSIGRPVIDAFYPAYGLFMLLYLRRSGREAMDRFEPALRGVDTATIDGYRRRLTGMTDREALLGLLIGAAVGIVTVLEYLTGPTVRTDIVGATPLSNAVIAVASVLGYSLGLMGVVFIVSALRAIPDVHRAATTIDLRHPDPAHAFASLSARGGILILVLVAFSAITDPATFEGVNLPLAVALPALAIVAFVAPLLGMRRRLERQKATLLDESTVRIESLEVELERSVDAGDLRSDPATDRRPRRLPGEARPDRAGIDDALGRRHPPWVRDRAPDPRRDLARHDGPWPSAAHLSIGVEGRRGEFESGRSGTCLSWCAQSGLPWGLITTSNGTSAIAASSAAPSRMSRPCAIAPVPPATRRRSSSSSATACTS